LTDEQRSGGDKDPQPAGQVWRLPGSVAPQSQRLASLFLVGAWRFVQHPYRSASGMWNLSKTRHSNELDFSVAGIDFSIQQTEKLLSGVINLLLSEASTYLSNLGTAWDSFSAHPISPFHRPSNC